MRGDLTIIKRNTIDLLGINYYQPRRVKAKETPIDQENGPMPEDYFDNYQMPGRKMNPYRGWEIYEKESMIFWSMFVRTMAISTALFLKMGWVSKMKLVSSKKTG